MSRAIPLQSIITAIHEGICKAHNDYYRWSGGLWLWNAPEYLSTVYVAQSIANIKKKKPYLSLEHGVKQALKSAGAGGGTITQKSRPGGKTDILLRWEKDQTPRAIIEIKSHAHKIKTISEDLNRIHVALHRKKSSTSIEFGIIAFHISWNNEDDIPADQHINDHLGNLEEEVRKRFGDGCNIRFDLSPLFREVGSVSAWQSVVIVLKRN